MSTTSDKTAKLNPQITSIEIGVRDLRTITIYPLSMADQFSMDKVITEAMSIFNIDDIDNEIELVGFVFKIIQDNLKLAIELVTDKEERGTESLLNEMTNLQITDLIRIIFEVNYETQIKNLKGLFEKAKKLFQPKRPSLQSVSDTEDTDLNTSSDLDTLKGELQEDS